VGACSLAQLVLECLWGEHQWWIQRQWGWSLRPLLVLALLVTSPLAMAPLMLPPLIVLPAVVALVAPLVVAPLTMAPLAVVAPLVVAPLVVALVVAPLVVAMVVVGVMAPLVVEVMASLLEVMALPIQLARTMTIVSQTLPRLRGALLADALVWTRSHTSRKDDLLCKGCERTGVF